ncbi:MAG: HEPN domain-containing protein [Gemmatimonadota bacterium]
MTEGEKIRALVAYRLEQAEEALEAADVNANQGLLRSAVNRAYYAMFYAVLAPLATRQQETARHSGAISLFDLNYVKTGLLPREFSRWLHDAFASRQDADYAAEFGLDSHDAEELIRHARSFVGGVRKHLESAVAE